SLRGDGIVAHRLFYAAGGESGIRAVEVSIHQTLDPRAGPIRPCSGARATRFSHSPCLLSHISLQPFPDLGGGDCSDFAGHSGRSAFAAFLLLVKLWSLGSGDARFVGEALRDPPGFYPVLFFRSGYWFCVDVLAALPGGFFAGLSRPPGVVAFKASGRDLARDVRPFCLSFLARRHRAGGICLGAQEAGGDLTQETEILQQKFAQLLGWEKTKRRERIFT